MSFLFSRPSIDASPEPKVAGVGHEDTVTNEQARPVPWFTGIARLPVTWLADAYDVRTVAIKKKQGKKKVTSGYQYYAGVAGLICSGPVDKITEIWMNQEQVWTGSVSRSGGDTYADITIETRGQFRIYWGTDDQAQDTLLLSGSGDAHPPYRRQCYFVCPDLFWGNNRTTVPTIEVVIERHPSQSWATETIEINDDHNPAYAIAELLQDPVFGLGLPDSRIDTTSFNDIAEDFADDSFGLSPYIDRQQSLRSILQMFNEHADLYLTSTADGKFKLNKPEVYASKIGLLRFVDADVKEAPKVTFHGWDTVITTTNLRYKNKDNQFKEDVVSYRDQGALAIVGTHKTQMVQRPWITKNDIAEKVCSKTGRLAAIPSFSGSFDGVESDADDLDLGEVFRFQWTESNLDDEIAICTALKVPPPGGRYWGIEFKSWFNDLYKENADAIGIVTPPTETDLTVVDLHSKFITELPLGLASQSDITFAPLLARGDSLTTGANVHLEQGTGNYNLKSTVESFGKKGRLTQAYSKYTDVNDASGSLIVELQSPDDTLESQNDTEAQDNTLLMFINPGGSDEEIISIKTASLVSGTTYALIGYRCRYDTRRQSHSTNDPVFIIERSQIDEFFDSQIIESGSSYNTKFQPFLGDQEFDLSSVSVTATPTAEGRAAKVQAPCNLTVQGVLVGGTYTTSDDVDVGWTLPDGYVSGDHTVLRFYDAAESTVYRTQILTAGETSYQYTNSNIIADYGSVPSTMIVRAYGKRSGSESTKFDINKATVTT